MDNKSNIYPNAPELPPQYGQTDTSANPAVITVQQPSVFVQAPIMQNTLGKMPTMAVCPSCHARQMTSVKYEPSTKTHLMALIICLVGGICCCCIPYCVDSCQSAHHSCPSCGAFVGAYQN